MTKEQILRWLFEYGKGYISTGYLVNTWADAELDWRQAVDDGWLDDKDSEALKSWSLKLTDKALNYLEEVV